MNQKRRPPSLAARRRDGTPKRLATPAPAGRRGQFIPRAAVVIALMSILLILSSLLLTMYVSSKQQQQQQAPSRIPSGILNSTTSPPMPGQASQRTKVNQVPPVASRREISANSTQRNQSPSLASEWTFTASGGTKHVDLLPQWIQDYVRWHHEMRSRFPGPELLHNPSAPGLILRTCLGPRCGGLHDRLGKLPWDLYLANKTGRVLLLHWCHPAPLQLFLQPNEIDWSISSLFPSESVEYRQLFSNSSSTADITPCDKYITEHVPRMFPSGKEARGLQKFWANDFDRDLQQASLSVQGSGGKKLLRHEILGNEKKLRELLRSEYPLRPDLDTLDWTPSFGRIFQMFFRPSAGLQQALVDTASRLDLRPFQYSAAHCRVRHPKAIPSKDLSLAKPDTQGKGPGGPDRLGLLWVGAARDYAIETANRAVSCTKQVVPDKIDKQGELIYFYSDSEDLVRFMTSDIYNQTFLSNNHTLIEESKAIQLAIGIAGSLSDRSLVGRQVEGEMNLHIDRQKGYATHLYYGSFIDLLIAAKARCIVFGVGNYALFAAKLSNTDCRYRHSAEIWGAEAGQIDNIIAPCPSSAST
jgi:hypothetical protein